MGFAIMSMTDAAAARIREIIASKNAAGGSGQSAKGVRVGIKKGGCAGMEYTVELVTEPAATDDHISHGGADLWIDPAAMLYLLGTQMDFEVTKLRSGFVFNNPNQSSACGCGESVELKAADLKDLAEARGQVSA